MSMILVPNREAIAEVRRLQASGTASGEETPVAAAETEPPTAGDLGDATGAPPLTGDLGDAEDKPPMAGASGDAEAAKDANNN